MCAKKGGVRKYSFVPLLFFFFFFYEHIFPVTGALPSETDSDQEGRE